MKPEEPIFADVLELPVSEREAFLERACGKDAALRARVYALLRAHAGTGAVLEVSPFSRAGAPDRAPGDEVKLEYAPGTRIGRYKLLQKLGEGGCGVVFMAEQEEPVRRRVALKVIKLGMDTREVIARFEAERQALALMDHPSIAHVLDAGSTEHGRPYFVMELVRGTPITRHCDEHQLDAAERLKLFIQVCSAVQHAHQKGIIHRDLKPSNILVTLHDGVPVPKIIDFGIAKAMHGRLTDRTLFTAFEQFVGTPAYMSPEQMELSGLDVDTRSDVYSLGVLLYELLTGRPPFESKELLQVGLDEMRRTIREKEPPKPSTRISTLNVADGATIAKQRGTDVAKLRSWLRGDIDWIVMRCLEKDRGRRYETANALAMDLQRYLRNEPVAARPPSRSYLIGKYSRRHRTAVVAGAVVLVALITGLMLALIGYRQTLRAQRESERQRAVAETAKRGAESARSRAEDLVAFMLQDLTPALQQYGRLQLVSDVAETADRNLAQLPAELQNVTSDRARAAALETLSGVRRSQGDWKRAEEALRAAIALRQKLSAGDPDSTAHLLINEWTIAVYEPGRTAAEWETYKRRLIGEFRELRSRVPESVVVKRAFAWALTDFSRSCARYFNQREDAVAAAAESRSLWEELIQANPTHERFWPSYIECLDALAEAHYANGQFAQSINVGEQAITDAETELKRDPWNLQLRGAAAVTARRFSVRIAAMAHSCARDAELIAREQFRMLLEIDPANQEWREGYAWSHAVEPEFLWVDGQAGAAREAWRKYEMLLEVNSQPASPTARGALIRLSLQLACAAARAGDRDDSDEQLRKAEQRFASYHADLPGNSVHPHQARAVWLHGRCLVAREWRDWPALALLASELIDESTLGLRYQPDEAELLLRRATAQSLLGLARLRSGSGDDAVATLRAAVEAFRTAPRALLRFTEPREALAADAAEWLAEALVRRGDFADAKAYLKSALAARETYLAREPDLWRWKQEFTRTAVLLARALDPTVVEEAARRRDLLERAAAILDAPENQPRMNAEDKACFAQFDQLRGRN